MLFSCSQTDILTDRATTCACMCTGQWHLVQSPLYTIHTPPSSPSTPDQKLFLLPFKAAESPRYLLSSECQFPIWGAEELTTLHDGCHYEGPDKRWKQCYITSFQIQPSLLMLVQLATHNETVWLGVLVWVIPLWLAASAGEWQRTPRVSSWPFHPGYFMGDDGTPVSAKPTQFSFPLCHSFPAVSSKCAQLLITLWTCSSHLFANQGCYLAWCYKRLQRPPVKIYPTVRKISCWSSVCIHAMPNAHNPVCSNTNLPLSILLSQVGNASELVVIQK